MKKFLIIFFECILHIFVCIIYSFLLCSVVISLLGIDIDLIDELFIIFLVGSFFVPPANGIYGNRKSN